MSAGVQALEKLVKFCHEGLGRQGQTQLLDDVMGKGVPATLPAFIPA